MNNVILMGRLTRDAKISYTSGAEAMCVARYTLAVDRRGKKSDNQPNADFISCVAFGKAGEFVEKYCKQGTKLLIEGHIQTGSYTNRDGNKVYTTDVIVDSQEFAESKGSSSDNTPQSTSDTSTGGFMNIPDGIDEELPFN